MAYVALTGGMSITGAVNIGAGGNNSQTNGYLAGANGQHIGYVYGFFNGSGNDIGSTSTGTSTFTYAGGTHPVGQITNRLNSGVWSVQFKLDVNNPLNTTWDRIVITGQGSPLTLYRTSATFTAGVNGANPPDNAGSAWEWTGVQAPITIGQSFDVTMFI